MISEEWKTPATPSAAMASPERSPNAELAANRRIARDKRFRRGTEAVSSTADVEEDGRTCTPAETTPVFIGSASALPAFQKAFVIACLSPLHVVPTIFHQLVSIGRAYVRRPVRSIGKSAWTNIVFLRIGTRLCLPAAYGALRSVLKTNAFFRFSPRQCRIFVPNRYRQHTHSPREREARRQKRGRALSSARPLLICGRA